MKRTIRNHTQGIMKALAMALVLSLCLSVCGTALGEAGTVFPWREYWLDVTLVTAAPDAVDVKDAPKNGVMVMVKLEVDLGTKAIKSDDIFDHSDDFDFRDGDGDEYKPYSMRVRGVDYDAEKGLFSTNPEQDGFEALFFLKGKTEEAISGAKLLVPSDDGNRVIVSLDKAPHDAAPEAASEAEASDGEQKGEESAASFVLGGIRYTIAGLEDEPDFMIPNRMDGKEGHTVAFSYAEKPKDAEAANKLLYSGARLKQPNGDLVRTYANMDNLGNPYVLFFGLSNDVLLTDCVFTIESDEGDIEIPLSDLAAKPAEEPKAEPKEEPKAEPTAEPKAEPTAAPAPVVDSAASDEDKAKEADATKEPEVALNHDADENERMVADALAQCAEGVKDEWQLAIYRAGIQDLTIAKDEKDDTLTVYTFLLRSFDPNLKALGKYTSDTKDGYFDKMIENAKEYGLEASLTMADGAFTSKSLKALTNVVKKAAASSQKAFKEKSVLNAICEELFYKYFPKKPTANDVVMPTDDYVTWTFQRVERFDDLSAQQRTAFFLGQGKQTLDVSGGPFALALKCTSINFEDLMEAARVKALDELAYMDYKNRWENDQSEFEFLLALADNAITMQKDGKEIHIITLNIDQEPFYGEEYAAFLGEYAYTDTLLALQEGVEQLPEYPAKQMPSVGRMSGSKNGTQVKIKAPKTSAAYYIQMRNYHNDEMVVSGFVKPGKTCVLRMPKGDYYAVMASGKTWYGEEYLFGDETRIQKTALIEIPNSNYITTLTLEASGGNIDVYGGDEDDLNK